MMDTRINVDLDTRYSWVVSIGSCFVNFCIYGLWRSYGILYVGFMNKYNISHQDASTPFLYACAIYHLIGPIVGILSFRFTLRSLQLIGCLLASFGVGMVYFSTNFTMVIVGVGIIQGIGLGIIRTLSNVVIQQYFYKFRAIATAISMSGGVFSSFFFPTLGSYLLVNYEIETSFLIFGFIILLASIGISVQRPPRYECNSINIDDGFVKVEKLNNKSMENTNSIKCLKCSVLNKSLECFVCKNNLNNPTTNQNAKINENPLLKLECSIEMNTTKNLDESRCKNKKISNANKLEGSAISNLVYISKRPMFYVITFTFVVYNICLQVFLMTIVDMTKKYEMVRDDVGIKLISLFSLADLIGRLGSGWFLDRNYISYKNVAIICEFTLLSTFLVLPNLDCLIYIQFATFFIGLMIGIITILWPLLNVEYHGTDKLAILLGLNCFFSGFESLFRPILIGYYLDHLNSYKYLYYNISGFIFFVILLWLIEPLLNKQKK